MRLPPPLLLRLARGSGRSFLSLPLPPLPLPLALALALALLLLLVALGNATAVASVDEDEGEGADKTSTSRRARWRARRLEKSTRIEPATLSRIERAFLRFEEALSEPVPTKAMAPIEESLQLVNENLGDLPYPSYRDRLFTRVGSIRSGGGLSFGLRLVQPSFPSFSSGETDPRPRPRLGLDATAAFSMNRYQFYRVRFGKLLPVMAGTALLGPNTDGLGGRGDSWFAYLDARYGDFREETLFRTPTALSEPDRDRGLDEPEGLEYRHRRAVVSGVVGYRLGRATASARVGLSGNRVGPAGERGEAAGTGTGTAPRVGGGLAGVAPSDSDFRELAASLQLDFLDVPGNARRGVFLDLFVARFDDSNDTVTVTGGGGVVDASSEARFTRLGIEARGFLPLGSPQRTLALRGRLSSDQTGDGGSVPFYLQRTLGGNETLRGFRDFRFRGENLMHLTVEYRFRPASYWGLSVFWDSGKTFPSFADGFDLEDLEHSFGVGSRIETPSSTVVRVQVAHSREGARFHIAMGMVF